jgi:hypothetical protein
VSNGIRSKRLSFFITYLGYSIPTSLITNLDIGIWNVKIEPTLGSDLTDISPFSYCNIIFEMVRPSPIPTRFICLDLVRELKNLNSFYRSSPSIPIPVSSTSVVSTPSLNDTRTVSCPLNVNFEAFPRRLKRICLNLF